MIPKALSETASRHPAIFRGVVLTITILVICQIVSCIFSAFYSEPLTNAVAKPSDKASELLAAASSYTQNLENLAMAVMGAAATLAYKFWETKVIRIIDEVVILFTFSTLALSIWFGKIAEEYLLDSFSRYGGVLTHEGTFHFSNHNQFVLLLAGTGMFLVLLLWRSSSLSAPAEDA